MLHRVQTAVCKRKPSCFGTLRRTNFMTRHAAIHVPFARLLNLFRGTSQGWGSLRVVLKSIELSDCLMMRTRDSFNLADIVHWGISQCPYFNHLWSLVQQDHFSKSKALLSQDIFLFVQFLSVCVVDFLLLLVLVLLLLLLVLRQRSCPAAWC